MSRSAPCATLIGRLTMALRARMEEGICDRWVESLASKARLHLTAELVAFEQSQGHALSLRDAAQFLSREVDL